MISEMTQTANSLAWLLSTCANDDIRNGQESLELALHCAEATSYQNPGVFNTLAAAYAETGDFKNAERWQRKALERAPRAMRAICQQRIERFRAGQPIRE